MKAVSPQRAVAMNFALMVGKPATERGIKEEREEALSPQDLRRWERTPHRRTVQIQPLTGGEPERPIATRLADFSAMGLGLIHSRRMTPGEQFVVPLGTLHGDAVPLLYAVVHCRGLRNGLFAIGAQLVSVMDLKEFSTVVPEGKSVSEYIRSLL